MPNQRIPALDDVCHVVSHSCLPSEIHDVNDCFRVQDDDEDMHGICFSSPTQIQASFIAEVNNLKDNWLSATNSIFVISAGWIMTIFPWHFVALPCFNCHIWKHLSARCLPVLVTVNRCVNIWQSYTSIFPNLWKIHCCLHWLKFEFINYLFLTCCLFHWRLYYTKPFI